MNGKSGLSGQDSHKPSEGKAHTLPPRIERRVRLARAFLIWERLWTSIWAAAALTGLFIACALMGGFDDLPLGLHWAALAAFGIMIATALWRGLRGFRWPDRQAALQHLETASGLAHQPLSAYEDMPAEGSGDPALWRAHQNWISQRLSRLKLGLVSPGLSTRDPYALRSIVVLLLVIGVTGTGDGRLTRISEAFFPGVGAARALTIEAWITPPAYTGQPPVYLERGQDDTASDSKIVTLAANAPARVPAGSTLSLRAHGLRNAPQLATDDDNSERHATDLQTVGQSNYMIDMPVNGDAHVTLTLGGRMLRRWTIETIADQPPAIRFDAPLQPSASGSLHFAYKVSDDYGVTSAFARVALAHPPHEPAATQLPTDSSALAAARRKIADLFRQKQPLPRIAPPEVTLPLKTLRPKDGKGETYVDLTPHPWAGLPVIVTLIAKDDTGQEGTSEPVEIMLPARRFTKPLAAATIEQRRHLAFNPSSTTRVARILDDLTRNGADYIGDTSVYLGLRAAYWRILVASRDSDLDGLFDLLWSVALKIEDGDLSLAEADLRRAREALTQALNAGASEDEIAHLLAAMRDAFQRYMDAIMAQAGNNPDQALMEKFAPQNGQTVDRDQLEKMLGDISDLAKNGSREEARLMLEKMQAIMENMQLPGESKGMSASEKAIAESIDKITALIDKQRALMDETFQAGAEGAQSGKGPSNKEMQSLKHAQQGLRDEFEKLLQALEDSEADIPAAFDKAKKFMESAEQRLDDGRTDRATGAQGQAIQGMKDGAQGLVNKLAESMTGQNGQGRPNNQKGDSKDPLGRDGDPSTASDGNIPSEIDRQTARSIIEELRRRAGELGRPKIELEYLDRLLDRF
tara:strand:+ start:124350 stop:126938 length:2589 start_codon:yes stop_codon:yes gene_type:complete